MKQITLTITEQEAELILGALAELPLKLSANVFGKIRQQRDAALATPDAEEDGTVLPNGHGRRVLKPRAATAAEA